jgi:cyanate permease
MTHEEYLYIKSGIPPTIDEKQRIPWCKFFASSAVWAIIISHFAGTIYQQKKRTRATHCLHVDPICQSIFYGIANWGFYILLTWLPTYFDKKLGSLTLKFIHLISNSNQ